MKVRFELKIDIRLSVTLQIGVSDWLNQTHCHQTVRETALDSMQRRPAVMFDGLLRATGFCSQTLGDSFVYFPEVQMKFFK